jgi:hypothetical protein
MAVFLIFARFERLIDALARHWRHSRKTLLNRL